MDSVATINIYGSVCQMLTFALPLEPHSGGAHNVFDTRSCQSHDTPPSRALCHCTFEKQKNDKPLEFFTHSFSWIQKLRLAHMLLECSLSLRLVLCPWVSSLLTWKWRIPWSTGHTWILQRRRPWRWSCFRWRSCRWGCLRRWSCDLSWSCRQLWQIGGCLPLCKPSCSTLVPLKLANHTHHIEMDPLSFIHDLIL